jgi:hypothetical protein
MGIMYTQQFFFESKSTSEIPFLIGRLQGERDGWIQMNSFESLDEEALEDGMLNIVFVADEDDNGNAATNRMVRISWLRERLKTMVTKTEYNSLSRILDAMEPFAENVCTSEEQVGLFSIPPLNHI